MMVLEAHTKCTHTLTAPTTDAGLKHKPALIHIPFGKTIRRILTYSLIWPDSARYITWNRVLSLDDLGPDSADCLELEFGAEKFAITPNVRTCGIKESRLAISFYICKAIEKIKYPKSLCTATPVKIFS